MTSYELFETVLDMQEKVSRLEQEVERAYASVGPHGQKFGALHGTHGHDPMASIDRLIDSDATRELELAKGRLLTLMDFATDVLYGKSGRGGVAKIIGTDEADMLCRHYCEGMSWAKVGRLFDPDSNNTTNMTVWCQRYARSVFERIDEVGMRTLANT